MAAKQMPMLFSGPMIRALLAGRKTETRRILKGAPEGVSEFWRDPGGFWQAIMPDGSIFDRHFGQRTSFGDLIWVKESHFAHGQWCVSDQRTKTGKPKRYFARVAESDVLFDLDPGLVRPNDLNMTTGWYTRPSLFMEKADSRLTMRVTGFNIERLHDITGEAALAEGVQELLRQNWHHDRPFRDYLNPDGRFYDTRNSYRTLWNSINGPDAWDANPWVEVTQFEVIRENILKHN